MTFDRVLLQTAEQKRIIIEKSFYFCYLMFHRRSLNVAPEQLKRVKTALKRKGFRSQQALVEEFAGSPSKSTVNNFFTGKDIDRQYFCEICEKLELDWQSVAEIADEEATPDVKRSPVEAKCVENAVGRGCLIRIKAPERMGQTSLINWLLKQAQQQGYQTVPTAIATATNNSGIIRLNCTV